MQRLGGFPHRPPPQALSPPIDLLGRYLSFELLDQEISKLNLALYHPTKYLREDLPEAVRAAYSTPMQVVEFPLLG